MIYFLGNKVVENVQGVPKNPQILFYFSGAVELQTKRVKFPFKGIHCSYF
jgi:hypothetical protein